MLISDKLNEPNIFTMMEARWFTPDIDLQQLSKLEAKQKLKKFEKLYRQDSQRILQIFKYGEESVFIANNNGEILNVNKHLLLSFNYEDKNDIIGHNMMSLFSEPYNDKVLKDIVKLFENGLIPYRKHSFKSFVGNKFSASIRMVLLTDEFNKTIGILGIFKKEVKNKEIQDDQFASADYQKMGTYDDSLKMLNRMLQQSYSEIQSYKKRLKAAEEEVEQYNRLKSTFLQNISHEIRTPLNGIVGFAELLTRARVSVRRRNEYSRIIKENTSTLLNIINDLLDVSRCESGDIKVSNSEFSINDFVKEIYQSFFQEIKEKELSFRIDSLLTDKQEYIYTDRTKLFRVFYHLISNSIKFTESGFIELGARVYYNSVQFYVKDTGSGISSEAVHDIFEYFRKGDDDKSKFEIGIGVGLSLSKAYIELLGGNITIDSDKGQGTTVYFSLPFKQKQKPDLNIILENDLIYEGINWYNKTILIVEDEEYNSFYLREILKHTNAHVIHAGTAKLAIEICKSVESIDVVLLDIKLPDMSGYNVSAFLKINKPDTIIIAQTAYSQEGDRKKALEQGCSGYLVKPIVPTVLINKLKEYLSV